MRKSSIGFKIFLIFQFLISVYGSSFAQKSGQTMIWILSDMLQDTKGITVLGYPKLIDSPYGKAVLFDGQDDGFLKQAMPLKDLGEFTIEIVIRFDSGGSNEQRYFHVGSAQQDRLLLEMRSIADSNTWYLDGFVQSGEEYITLISPELTHPMDEWYHIAITVKDGSQVTFVNGKRELEGSISFSPILEGITAIGVRQNKISWFKGAIYSICLTDKILNADEFRISEWDLPSTGE